MAGNENDDATGVDETTTRDGGGRRSTAGSASSAQANAANSRSSHLKAMQAKARRRLAVFRAVAMRDEGQGLYFVFVTVVVCSALKTWLLVSSQRK